MLSQTINYSKSLTKNLQNNQKPFLDIFPQKYFSYLRLNNFSHHLVKQQVTLAKKYWHNQQIAQWRETIHQLGKLAEDYPQSQGIIIEFLSEFVRHNAPYNSSAKAENSSTLALRPEIPTVCTIIAKISRQKSLENQQLDLSYTDIRGANLPGANLERANLYHVNLAGANLSQANLSGAILTAANLSGANLSGANLSGAILSAANLSQANLAGADLSRANLYLAHLHGAILDNTRLDGANLRDSEIAGK